VRHASVAQGFLSLPGLNPPKPIPIKDRSSYAWVQKGRLDVEDGAFVVADDTGIRTQIPVGALTCLFLGPGSVVTHAAVKLAAQVGCLLIWAGEGGVRFYAAGQPGGSRSDRLLHQARLALDEHLRLSVVRKMYKLRFGEDAPMKRSLDQLRGIEASRVKETYAILARRYGVKWKGRSYDPKDGRNLGDDLPNVCLSAANACLYGVCEAAILAAGYAPAIGFLHSGKPKSFVYDIGDIVKFEVVSPVAFKIAADNPDNPERSVRLACRDMFRETKLLKRLVPLIEDVLTVEGVIPPSVPPEALPIAFEDEKATGDVGHRS
jgi:CRISPR-associated protein Cas1